MVQANSEDLDKNVGKRVGAGYTGKLKLSLGREPTSKARAATHGRLNQRCHTPMICMSLPELS